MHFTFYFYDFTCKFYLLMYTDIFILKLRELCQKTWKVRAKKIMFNGTHKKIWIDFYINDKHV